MAVASPAASANHAGSVERDRLERKYANRLREELRLARLVSYVGNKSVPFLRLYRYKEAFAHEFVSEFLRRFRISASDYVLDPFAGMGTTLFTCWLQGIPAVGIDRLPIAAFVADTLPRLFDLRPGQLRDRYAALKREVDKIEPAEVALDVPIMGLAFKPESLLRLRQWKAAVDALDEPERSAFTLLFFAGLEACSFTSKDGQFLRLKRDKVPAEPDEELGRKVALAEEDLLLIHHQMMAKPSAEACPRPRVFLADARQPEGVALERAPTALITSPPYVNRYDYTRSYCLELCFHFVKDFTELRALRHGVLRSHIESKVHPHDEPPHPAVGEVVEALAGRNLNNPRIPHMVLGYFVDMDRVLRQWGEWLAPGAQVAMVVDNVRFEGEHVPADLLLSDMAAQYGFETLQVVVTRYKGNSSQQMGKYGRMPVRESVVIWSKA